MKKGLMKKIIATAVLGIMTMGLAGCGSSNDKNSAFEISKKKQAISTPIAATICIFIFLCVLTASIIPFIA